MGAALGALGALALLACGPKGPPVETPAAPVEAAPVEAAPVEAAPVEAAPVEGPAEGPAEEEAPRAEVDLIRPVLGGGQREVRLCYDAELRRTRGVAGRIAVDVEIVGGMVESVRVTEDTIGSEAMTACLVGVIRGWVFSSEVNDRIYLPFVFQAD